MATKHEITQRLVELLPDSADLTVDQALRSWYMNLRKDGGLRLTDTGYQALIMLDIESWPVDISYNLDELVSQADAIIMLRVQRERMNELFFPNAREYSRYFGLNSDRVKAMKKDSIIMHPGPMNRGLEITADVADSARSVIVEQVSNGVSVRMAILYTLLTGEGIESGALA
jgi:aspartate carbamoyltransferase catalytic subunit